MTHTRDAVVAAVDAAFPGGDAPAVLALLDQYGTEAYEREKERVQLAIVKLSGGSEEKLRSLVQAAKIDYRDILAWQELGPLPGSEGQKLQNEVRGLLKKWGKV